MPELPEVETVRAGVAGHVIGRRIAAVQVLHPRAVRRHVGGSDSFAAAPVGLTVTSVNRRGKYLWLVLAADAASRGATPAAVPHAMPGATEGALGEQGGDGSSRPLSVLAHLGMSGQLLVDAPERADPKHLRVRIRFDDGGSELRFVDQRTFGGLVIDELVPAGDGADTVPALVAHIARDPLDSRFDAAAWVRRVRGSRTEIKRSLLDQRTISGVGNIYADESLWRARIHGARPTGALTAAKLRDLLAAIRAVMAEALAAGGTSFDSLYVNVNGQSGYFDRSLAVYGRAGEPCPRCGTAVRRTPFMNRSSYWCPRCQPPPRVGR